LMKSRMTILLASNQAAGIALAPIAGAISAWGLNLPWLVCGACGIAAGLFCVVFFRNAAELKAAREKKFDSVDEKRPSVAEDTPSVPVYKDRILLVLLCSYFSIFLCVSALVLLVPLLLEYPEFELLSEDVDTTRQAIANAAGVMAVPNGVCNLFFGTFVYLMVSTRFGDLACVRLGCISAAASFALYGYVAQKFWHLCLLHAVNGAAVGLAVPAIGPVTQAYTTKAHAKQQAQANAFPMFGLSLGMMAGPMIFGGILGPTQDRSRMNLAWLVAGASFFVGYLCLECGFRMIMRHPSTLMSKLTPEQYKLAVASHAKPQEEFIDDACAFLRSMLTEGSEHYRGFGAWHGLFQKTALRALSETFPKLRPRPQKMFPPDKWHEAPAEDQALMHDHFEDLMEWIRRFGTEEDQAYVAARFPQFSAVRVAATDGHADLGHFMHTDSRDAARPRAQSDGATPRAVSPSARVAGDPVKFAALEQGEDPPGPPDLERGKSAPAAASGAVQV